MRYTANLPKPCAGGNRRTAWFVAVAFGLTALAACSTSESAIPTSGTVPTSGVAAQASTTRSFLGLEPLPEAERKLLTQSEVPLPGALTDCAGFSNMGFDRFNDPAAVPLQHMIVFPPGTLTLPEDLSTRGYVGGSHFTSTGTIPQSMREAMPTSLADHTSMGGDTIEWMRAVGESQRGSEVRISFYPAGNAGVLYPASKVSLRPGSSEVLSIGLCDRWSKRRREQFVGWLAEQGDTRTQREWLDFAAAPEGFAYLAARFEEMRAKQEAEVLAMQQSTSVPPLVLWLRQPAETRSFLDPGAGLSVRQSVLVALPDAWRKADGFLLCARTVTAWSGCFAPTTSQLDGEGRLLIEGFRGDGEDLELMITGYRGRWEPWYSLGKVPASAMQSGKQLPVVSIESPVLAGSGPGADLALKQAAASAAPEGSISVRLIDF